MWIHIVQVLIGVFAILICGWLTSTVLDNVGRGAKVDKFLVFWAIYALITGAFLVITA